jgi:hypothetical protein
MTLRISWTTSESEWRAMRGWGYERTADVAPSELGAGGHPTPSHLTQKRPPKLHGLCRRAMRSCVYEAGEVIRLRSLLSRRTRQGGIS